MALEIASSLGASEHTRKAPVSSLVQPGNGEAGVDAVARNLTGSIQGTSPVQSALGNRASGSSDSTDPQHRELTKAVGQLQEFVQSMKRNLEFSIDSDSGQIVIKVIDSETDRVIRQIPPEEVLHFARSLNERQGSLIRMKA